MKKWTPILSGAVASALFASAGFAQETAKDIVLARLAAPVVAVTAAQTVTRPTQNAVGDAMAVSVLLESVNGTLTPKSTKTLFQTGDRFRVKILATRHARVSLYNTNPLGVTNPKPLWQGTLRVGEETVSPRLQLTGTSGVDQLHVVLEPVREANAFVWLGNWLRTTKDDASSKDIRLDVQNTPTATYLVNPQGQGLITTVRIAHTAY
ncbi:MAG: hypothetical protein IPH35_10600 [Rhodoferax sp.]|nr:hypothetical protein [Rhodoferax sp.]